VKLGADLGFGHTWAGLLDVIFFGIFWTKTKNITEIIWIMS
jgi:hypothetical protein